MPTPVIRMVDPLEQAAPQGWKVYKLLGVV